MCARQNRGDLRARFAEKFSDLLVAEALNVVQNQNLQDFSFEIEFREQVFQCIANFVVRKAGGRVLNFELFDSAVFLPRFP